MDDETVRVLQFTDDGSVYVSTSIIDEILEIQEEINEFVSSRHMKYNGLLPPERKELCLARHNGEWCRGEIQKCFVSMKLGTLAEVLLIDYGTRINTGIEELIYAHDSSLSLTPPLAIILPLSTLHHPVVPTTVHISWHEAVWNIFRNLVGRTGDDGWGIVTHCMMRGESIELFHGTKGGKIISFNELLISAGYLKKGTPPSIPVATPRLQVTTPTSDMTRQRRESSSTDDLVAPPTLNKFLPAHPKQHHCVYIEGVVEHETWNELKDTPFHTSLIKSLEQRGFQHPTAVQAYGWPQVWAGHDTILLSSNKSGKTLAYLLPLLCLADSERKLDDTNNEPSVLILVSESFKAWNINNQATTILSWLNAELRFKSTDVYFTAESDAVCCILNGVHVLVATPPSLLRLVDRKILTLLYLKHIVLDDMNSLYRHFCIDVTTIFQLRFMKKNMKKQIIGCTSLYMPQPWAWLRQYMCDPVTVVTNPLELMILKHIQCSVIASSFPAHVVAMLIQDTPTCNGNIVVCVSNENEASKLIQILSISSINGVTWRDGEMPVDKDVVVICDDALLNVEGGEGIGHLVHYSLPADKGTFLKRLSLLIPSLLVGVVKPQLTIFITDNDIHQSRDLLQLLTRLGQLVPEELVKMAEKRQLERIKNQQNLLGLCDNLKAYGVCMAGPQCKMAHSTNEVTQKRPVIPKPHPPKNGVVKIKVEHVSSPVQLWVKILDHTPSHRGEQSSVSPSLTTLGQLSLDLALFYSSPEHRVLHRNPHKGDYCGLRETSGECYRIVIMDFSSPLGLYFHHKEKAKVRLIDKGDVLTVDVNQLLTLPEEFLTTPPLVIETYICGLRPLDNDIDWPPQSAVSATKMLEGRFMIGRVALSHDTTMWLDPIEERVVLEGLRITTALFVPQKEMIKAGLAAPNPKHLQQLRDVLTTHHNTECPLYEDCRRVSLSEVTNDDVTLTAINSLSSLYIQPASSQAILQSISDRLNSAHSRLNPAHSNGATPPSCTLNYLHMNKKLFKPGQMCAALFPHDKKWYRASILKVAEIEESSDSSSDSGGVAPYHMTQVEYLCLFVDYGDREWVWSKGVEPICPELLEFPLQAVHCSLETKSLEIAGMCDDESAIEKLWNIVEDVPLRVKVLSIEENCVSLTNEEHTDILTLFTTDTELVSSDQSIVDEQKCDAIMIKSQTISDVLILIHQGHIPMNQLFTHLINNRGKIKLSLQDINIFSNLLKQSSHNRDITYAIMILLHSQPTLVQSFIGHSSFCDTLMSLLKKPDSSEILLTTIKLVKLLYLTSRGNTVGVATIILNPNDLVRTLCSIIVSSDVVKIVGHSLDIVTCIVTSEPAHQLSLLSVVDQLLHQVSTVIGRSGLTGHCVRLLCGMIMRGVAVGGVTRHFRQLTLSMNKWPTEVRECLLYAMCVSPSIDIKAILKEGVANGWAWSPESLSPIEKAVIDSINSHTHISLSHTYSTPDSSGVTKSNVISSNSVQHNIEQETESHKRYKSQRHLVRSMDKPTTSPSLSPSLPTSMGLTPKVLWSQTRTILCLSVQVRGCGQQSIKCDDHTVAFRCVQDSNVYSFTLNVFGSISKHKSSVSVKGGEVLLKLAKQHEHYWPRLTQSKHRPSFIAIDYDRWKEESSDSSDCGRRVIPWSNIKSKKAVSNEDEYLSEDEDHSDDSADYML